MARPKKGDEVTLKRMIRYLRGAPCLVYKFKWQDPMCTIRVFTDSDWAGCVRTRKSTSGGAMLHGDHLISHWARTQATIALSSGEAELNASL